MIRGGQVHLQMLNLQVPTSCLWGAKNLLGILERFHEVAPRAATFDWNERIRIFEFRCHPLVEVAVDVG